MPYALELHGIVKRFPGVLANDHIDLAVKPGEIRALVGENGAGKTTLMRVLYGLYKPDAGTIAIHGQPRTFHSPHDAICAGLGMVHQHFMLFPSLTVWENVVYGMEPTRGGFIDRQQAKQQVTALSEQYGLEVEPESAVKALPVGVRQRVEILKILYRQADIFILDEPTAVLTPQEQEGLFSILKNLAEQGKTLIFITHKLHEVMSVSNSVTVLRNGRITANFLTHDTTPTEICRSMIGREATFHVERVPQEPGDAVLTVDQVSLMNQEQRPVIHDVSFQVKAGEIVGIAGVAGNGQTELVQAITGLRPVSEGHLWLSTQEITSKSVAERRRAGMAYIPEDRGKIGSAGSANISENLIMGSQRQPYFSRKGFQSFEQIRSYAEHLIEKFSIKTPSFKENAGKLSGGNLQKVVAAREFSQAGTLIIAEQPTRGLDISSIEFIHKELMTYRNEGKAILMVSAELSEVLDLSDRILVIYKGRIVGEFSAQEATEEALGLLMAGETIEPDKQIELCKKNLPQP